MLFCLLLGFWFSFLWLWMFVHTSWLDCTVVFSSWSKLTADVQHLHVRGFAHAAVWLVGLKLNWGTSIYSKPLNTTLVAVNHISLLKTFNKINTAWLYFFFPFFLSFFNTLVRACSASHGLREPRVTHTLENVSFFHCLRVRISCRTRAVNARRLLLIDTLQEEIKRDALAPVLIHLRRYRRARTWWSVSSALAGKQRSDLFLLSVCLAYFYLKQLFLLPLWTCLPSDEWHCWCVKHHVTMDFHWLLAPPLSVKSFGKQSGQCCLTLLL